MCIKRNRVELIPIRFLLIAAIIIIVGISSLQSLPTRRIMRRNKRGFASLKCFGENDRSKFASLNQVCEECYQLYRDQNLHKSCRQDCFQNQIFLGCVDALLLSHEHKKLKEMVNLLNGKK